MNALDRESPSRRPTSAIGAMQVPVTAPLVAPWRARDRSGDGPVRVRPSRRSRAGGLTNDMHRIGGEGCVIIKSEGLRFSGPEDMESPHAVKDEFESQLESIHASTASSPRSGASWAPLRVEFRDLLDEIDKAHET